MQRTALLDIETSPALGYVWQKWQTDVIEFKEDWIILSFSYQWLGEKKVYTYGLPDFPLYKKDKRNDKAICQKLWELFDEADIIIAHNGDGFDVPKVKTRLLIHGFPPPSPSKTIDTLKICRTFGFLSNKLDDVCQTLGIGRKIAHTGKHLWLKCTDIIYHPKEWGLMKKYNAHDVVLLLGLYEKIRSWHKNHPALHDANCPVCGSNLIQRRGTEKRVKSLVHRLHCNSCGKWFYGEKISSIIKK